MPPLSSDIARCRQSFAACCVDNGKCFNDIKSVGAGIGHVMIWFNQSGHAKPAMIPSAQPLEDMFIWENVIRPDMVKGKHCTP